MKHIIRHLRTKKGLSQSQLAEKLRLSTSHVSRMERHVKGYRASYETIKLLSKELEECPIKIFLFFSNIDCKAFKIGYEFKNSENCTIKTCTKARTGKIRSRLRLKKIRRRINKS